MSYSAHRPGRFGSDGQIEFEAPTESDEPMYLQDFLRETEEAEQRGGVPADETPTEPQPAARVEPEPEAEEPEILPVFVPRREPVDGPEPAVVVPDPEPASEAETEAFDSPLFAQMTTPIEPDEQPARRADNRTRPRRRVMRRLAILGGADGATLDEVPVEIPRFAQMFFVLAGTALVSALSMFFALTTAVQVWIAVAIPLAIVWALIIFNLDRFLTSSMRSTKSPWKLFGLAFPRVIMAALIGIVVAEPLVLQIFHNDINREVTATNLVQAQSDQDQLANGPEQKALTEAKDRLAALENQASTGIVAGTSSESATTTSAQANVDKLTQQMADQQKVIDQARAIYQCELTGTGVGTVAGCTGIAGQGTSSDAAKAQLEQAQSTYDGLAAQLRTANSELATAQTQGNAATAASEETNRKEAQAALPAAQAEYKTALAAYNARAETVANGNAGAVGLLSQISALERLSEANPVLGWAHWLIAALFFMIELLPVLVKVLTSWGNPSVYEQADDIRKQVALDRATATGWRERAQIAATPGG